MGTILLVILILMLIGAVPSWSHSRNWGHGPSGGLGLVVLVLLITRVHLQGAPQRLAAKRPHLRALSGATRCCKALATRLEDTMLETGLVAMKNRSSGKDVVADAPGVAPQSHCAE